MVLHLHRHAALSFVTFISRPFRQVPGLTRLSSRCQPSIKASANPQRRPLTCTRAPAEAAPGTLYLVATPIGHPHDITLRAQHILSTATVIAAEDTRVTSALLSTLGLQRPQGQSLLSCHAHNFRTRIPHLLGLLADGASVALVSDAGMPCISDPGADVVSAAIRANVPVVPLPGACAAVTALMGTGLNIPRFLFVGFLPRSGSSRRAAIDHLAKTTATVVCYEAPHRVRATLEALAEHAGLADRHVTIARELTKKYEQFLRFDNLEAARDHFVTVEPRGEFTIVLSEPFASLAGSAIPSSSAVAAAAASRRKSSLGDYNGNANCDFVKLVEALVRDGVAVSAVAKMLAASSDVPKKLIYTYATQFKNRLADDSLNTSETEHNLLSRSLDK